MIVHRGLISLITQCYAILKRSRTLVIILAREKILLRKPTIKRSKIFHEECGALGNAVGLSREVTQITQRGKRAPEEGAYAKSNIEQCLADGSESGTPP